MLDTILEILRLVDPETAGAFEECAELLHVFDRERIMRIPMLFCSGPLTSVTAIARFDPFGSKLLQSAWACAGSITLLTGLTGKSGEFGGVFLGIDFASTAGNLIAEQYSQRQTIALA